MKYLITLLLLMLFIPSVRTEGQKFKITGDIHYGQYRMKDLKKVQNFKLQELGLPGQITENFPWTLQYSGEFNMEYTKFSMGFSYFFCTSGSRVSYGDYSGVINMDVKAICNGFGPTVKLFFYKDEKLAIGPGIQIPLMFSRITEKNNVRIFEVSQIYSEKTYSWSMGIFPSLEAEYNLSRFSLGLKISYLIDSRGRLVHSNDRTIYLSNKEYVTSDWSGFNVGIRLGYTLASLP
jgi:hypothetical protein